jgi:hypothetical protein
MRGIADRHADALGEGGAVRQAVKMVSAVSRRALDWVVVMPSNW